MPHVQQTVDPVRLWVDSSDMPKNIPHADEVGCSSAPLESMAYFFGSYCSKYNEDFMLCKNENPHPEHCLKEGRRVTRCALDL
jgi:NADH dehydrogenase (ubiquinone) 1 alpha subcomplex subunit 8